MPDLLTKMVSSRRPEKLRRRRCFKAEASLSSRPGYKNRGQCYEAIMLSHEKVATCGEYRCIPTNLSNTDRVRVREGLAPSECEFEGR